MEFALGQRARVRVDTVPLPAAVKPHGRRVLEHGSKLCGVGHLRIGRVQHVYVLDTAPQPAGDDRGLDIGLSEPSALRLPPLVGTTTNFPFSAPPPSSMNFSMIVVPSVDPPPTMTSVPLGGPYSGGLSGAGAGRRQRLSATLRRPHRRGPGRKIRRDGPGAQDP
jgi:hypothetical protein